MKQCKTILLADANLDFQNLVQDELEKAGPYSVALVSSGNDVPARVRDLAPCILLMDLFLPGINGLEVLHQLRQQGLAPLTVLISGLISRQTLQQALDLGVSYVLPKPFTTDALLAAIESILQDASTLQVPPAPNLPVTAALQELGMPAHFKGYQYVRYGISLVMRDASLLHAVTKALYPMIARQYGTTSVCVERAIRHAIHYAWTCGSRSARRKYFGPNCCARPANGAFIAAIADHLNADDAAC